MADSYVLTEAVTLEMPDALGERFTLELDKGALTPKSEREELAGAHLEALGLAKRTKAKG